MLHFCNLPRELCHKLIGKEHTTKHRMVAGLAVMVVGVAVAKASEFVHFPGSHHILDLVGYGLHGLGLTPFIEHGLD